MSLYGRVIGAAGTDAPIEDVLAGNLCRCTGYGPIKAAGETCSSESRDDRELVSLLKGLQRTSPLHLIHEERHWFAPRNLDELATLRLEYPQALLIAGATDVGLWVTKKHAQLKTVISLAEVADLKTIHDAEAGLTLGAGVRYVEAHKALGGLHPAMGELVRRIGGAQVRNAGTIGGNIANGSPIGDTPPALIALGAQLTLRRGDERRTIDLEDFFIAYGIQDLQPGEFVESIFVPRPATDDIIRMDKLSKRFDSDITAVLGAFKLTLKDGVITDARLAFGGMAGTPKRATHAEALLRGSRAEPAVFELVAKALSEDFTPLSDVRGSSAYRLTVAGNLLRRLGREASGEPVPSLHEAEAIDG
jgi:xanthine dehydrogenase small subunit